MKVLNYVFELIEEKKNNDVASNNSAKIMSKFFGIKEKKAKQIVKVGMKDRTKGTKLFRQELKKKDKKSVGLGMIALGKFAFKFKKDPKIKEVLSKFNKEQEKTIQEALDPVVLGAVAILAFLLLSRFAFKLILLIGVAIAINPSLLDSISSAADMALQGVVATL